MLLIKAVVYKKHMTCFCMYNSSMFVLVCCTLPLEVFKVNNVKNMTNRILQPRTLSIYLLIIGVITECLVSLYLYLTLMLMKTLGDQVFYNCTFVFILYESITWLRIHADHTKINIYGD